MSSDADFADKVRSVLDYDETTGEFTWKKGRGGWTSRGKINRKTCRGYYRVKVFGKLYFAHRLAWLMVYGELPCGDIDHVNRDTTDNRICNLRIVNQEQNQHNSIKPLTTSTSGLRGVSFHKSSGKWVAQIRANGKQISLGLHATKEDAYSAYLAAKSIYHPEFKMEAGNG